MLQNLVVANRPAELLACLQIVEGHCLHRLHGADRLGAHRGDAVVDHLLQQRKTLALGAEHGVGTHRHIGEGQLGGAQAVVVGEAASMRQRSIDRGRMQERVREGRRLALQ